MKKLSKVFVLCCCFPLLFASCKDDDSRSCVSCTSPITPNFELCRESNGHASVNGEDTGVSYQVYLDGIMATGANCD